MKNLLLLSSLAVALIIAACTDDFLDQAPQGTLNPSILSNSDGVESLLIGAYSLLDGWEGGWSTGGGAPWNSAASNWVYGDVYSDDAYKGSEAGDQGSLERFEDYTLDASNPYLIGRWARLYDGIARANDVIRVVTDANDIEDAEKTAIVGEAQFLRAHYHFEAQRLWGSVPYIDEKAEDVRVPNTGPIWAQIEADMAAAKAALPTSSRNGQVGRANKLVAAAYLGKIQLYQNKYAEALSNFNEVINSGAYALFPSFHDNFRTSGNNGIEAIFQIQASVNDGAGGENGNMGDQLNHLQGGPGGGCCGFHQPSQNLVNAFKTENGLPLLNTFNLEDITNDDGIPSDQDFSPHTGPLDPRLDWTVGRRGIPYLDWGTHPGADWIRNQAFMGPYNQVKKMYYASEQGVGSDTQAGWHGAGRTALNYSIIRYADVLLMAAECQVELGNLEEARALVNQVRTRVTDESTWVKTDAGENAANYEISTYDSPWTDVSTARLAVRFERRLELATEGHRFFDLNRWNIAQDVIDAYIAKEKLKRPHLNIANFQDRNTRFPIPQEAIDESTDDEGNPTLIQNPGF